MIIFTVYTQWGYYVYEMGVIMRRLIIDVREAEEYATSHVNGAVNIPSTQLIKGAKYLNNIPKNTEIILYCMSGSRANRCMMIIENLGFTNVSNGISQAYVEENYL
jgi:rhodanese-related sulfurtransferase